MAQTKEQKKAKQRKYRKRAKAYVIDVKSTSSCKDCGVHHPFYRLQFDKRNLINNDELQTESF
jgi:ribosomal protein L32